VHLLGAVQNASLRARKSTALAGVGFENSVSWVGLAPPEANFCALSRPNPGIYTWSCLHCFFMCLYYTIPVDEMSIRESLILGVQKPDF
jgi:hypothetical protein